MADTGKSSVIKRKTIGSHDGAAVTDRSALRAFRLGLARGSGERFNLALAVIGASHSRCLQPEAVARIDDKCLMVVLDGPDGIRGAAQIDMGLCTAIVQQQTMGSIAPLSALDPDRGPTPTDAALVAPVLDEALSRAEKLVEVASDRRCITGYRFGAKADTARSLGLGLVSDRYRVFDLDIDIGVGTSKGKLTLIFPDPPDKPDVDVETEEDETSGGNAMFDLPTDLDAILSTMILPLGKVGQWKTGDILPLPPGTDLAKTRLVSASGAEVAICKLGQVRGIKAVRLSPMAAQLPEVPPPQDASFEDLERFRSGDDLAGEAGLPSGPVENDMRLPNIDLPDVEPGGLDLPDADQGEPMSADFPAMGNFEATDLDLSDLSPEEAAQEITELAGLPTSLDDLNPGA